MSFFSVIDFHGVVLTEEFDCICIARGYVPAETPVQDILDELKEAMCALYTKSCEGRWCSFENSQRL